jgi:hypothetical protein
VSYFLASLGLYCRALFPHPNTEFRMIEASSWGGPTGSVYPTLLVRAESVIALELAPLASLTTPNRFHSLVFDMARDQLRADLAHDTVERVRRKYALLRGVFLARVRRGTSPHTQ